MSLDQQLLTKARFRDVPLKKVPAWFSARPFRPGKAYRMGQMMYFKKFWAVRGPCPAPFLHAFTALSIYYYIVQYPYMCGEFMWLRLLCFLEL